MIQFQMFDHQPERCEKYHQMLTDNLPVLEGIGSEADFEKYGDSLGWFNIDTWANEAELSAIEELAAKVRRDADVFVLIGVGGSNNAARSVIEAFPECDGPEIVYAGNSLSPWAFEQVMNKIRGKSVYIDCIAKNFQTLEPGSAFRVLREYLYETYGDKANERIIATGSRNSLLEAICREHGYSFVEFPQTVGGRYTAVTAVGLLPMAVAGIDIRALVKGAADMAAELKGCRDITQSAYRYAVARNLYYNEGYRMEMLASFEPQLHWFYKWWIQLFAESEGKDDQGLYPISGEYSEELHSVGQFLQDGSPVIFETFLHVKDPQVSMIVHPDGRVKDDFDYLNGKDFREINEAAYGATLRAHSEKMPCMVLEVEKLTPYSFGEIFYFFMYTCYVSAGILGVNPFDQEGVEAYKQRMFKALGK